jgi:hypothetical protein
MPSDQDRLVTPKTALAKKPSPQRSPLVAFLSKCMAAFVGIAVIGYLFDLDADAVMDSLKSAVVPESSTPAPFKPRISAPATRAINTEDHPSGCQLVTTKPVEFTKKLVYRWVDAQGVTHYSDKMPLDQQTDITLDRIIERRHAFSVEVKSFNASTPAYLQDRISQSARRIYAFMAEPLRPEDIRKSEITVNLIGDRDRFLNAYGLLKPGQRAPNGFYTTRTHEAYVHAQGSPDQVQATAIHEASHLILTTLYQHTPLWLNEGFAEYFEILPISAINRAYQPKTAWVHALRSEGLIPFDTLFKITPERWRSMRPEVTYANAWAVVYFLMQTNQGRTVLKNILKEIKANPCKPVSSTALLHAGYRHGLSGLRADMIRWLRGFN